MEPTQPLRMNGVVMGDGGQMLVVAVEHVPGEHHCVDCSITFTAVHGGVATSIRLTLDEGRTVRELIGALLTDPLELMRRGGALPRAPKPEGAVN